MNLKQLILTLLIIICFSGISRAQWTSSGDNISFTNGNVGIGTATPSATLHIFTNAKTGISLFGNSANWIGCDLQIQRASASSLIGAAPNIQLYDQGSGSSTMIQSYQGNLQFFTSSSAGWYEHTFLSNTGNFGIGTGNPLSLLQVDDGCTMASLGDASGQGLNYGTSYLGFNAARSVAAGSWTSHGDGVHNGGGVVYSDIAGNMLFSIIPSSGAGDQTLPDATVKNNIKMMISATDGSVHAKAFYVTLNNWPDYVFSPTYQLPELSQVKYYIDQYHHLPDMPSTSDVAQNGLNVGETEKILTRKVEELTLYLVDKDEQLTAQKKTITELQQQLAALQNDIEKIKSQVLPATVAK